MGATVDYHVRQNKPDSESQMDKYNDLFQNENIDLSICIMTRNQKGEKDWQGRERGTREDN